MYLVKDTAVKVAEDLPFESLLKLSLVNKKFYGWIWENFDFWKAKLLIDYKFNYVKARDVKVAIFYYKILHSVITKEKNIDLKLVQHPDLLEFLRNILSGECEYTFTRGIQRGEKCGKPAKRYYSHYFCDHCSKKAVVQMQIQESEKRFNVRKKKF